MLAGVQFLLSQPGPAMAQSPRVFILDGDHLARLRQDLRNRPDAHAELLADIRRDADEALEDGPWSVMDKPLIPPSGDKHDYYSIGPYWWPDPAKADGLPYIRRDGETNPDREKYDNNGMGRMRSAVEALARGWYFTGEPAYAERVALLLRTWFLDAETRMNPHLQYGQAIPGICDGRPIGIIDTAGLITLVDAVGLLESAEAWTDDDQQQLQAWFREYVTWLLTSEHGKGESQTKNNHAVWYDAQVASFALYAGDTDTAHRVLAEVGPRRIATQIEPDGRMPLELARTKSFDYTSMNLRGFLHLARLGEHVGVDLWGYRSDDGRSIEAALDWFAPFVAGEREWTFQQIRRLNRSSATMLYRRAALRLDKLAYRMIAANVSDRTDDALFPPLP
jgi:hypothetical protein